MGFNNGLRVSMRSIEVEFQSVLLIEHAGRDDVHEQREADQSVEGIIHVPPELGTRGSRVR